MREANHYDRIRNTIGTGMERSKWRFASNRPNHENEETRKADKQNNDRVAKQNEQATLKQRMMQLNTMAE